MIYWREQAIAMRGSAADKRWIDKAESVNTLDSGMVHKVEKVVDAKEKESGSEVSRRKMRYRR